MHKIKLAILGNEQADEHTLWVKACGDKDERVEYDIIDFTSDEWLAQLLLKKYDFLLAKPPGINAQFKQLYDERISIIDTVLNLSVYPSPTEIYIYENKRFLYSWLSANNLPHPQTHIFYSKPESLSFLEHSSFPIIAKANIGASGSGVKILHDKADAVKYINQSFSSKGAPRRWGPNLTKGSVLKRGFHYIVHPKEIINKLSKYQSVRLDKQIGFVIFQKYIPHDFEWRIVAIGDSYFAHKKLKIGNKASGSLLKAYDNPPIKLFDFAKSIMDKYGFFSQAIDVFETKSGEILINEMQCIFGQSDPYQMLVDGTPGRYIWKNCEWIFEAGDFNKNQSYNLRVEHVLSKFEDV